MTEAEWLICAVPEPMLDLLRDRVSDRKLRLFAIACARRVVYLLRQRKDEEAARRALNVAIRFADSKASVDELVERRKAVHYRSFEAIDHGPGNNDNIAHSALDAAYHTLGYPGRRDFDSSFSVREASLSRAAYSAASAEAYRTGSDTTATAWVSFFQAESIRQVTLLHCIVGNPFPPVRVGATWQTATAISLAQVIYDARAFDRLPILADALEDAGCTNADVLNHCRQPGEHVRGCWVVDLLLGKE